MGALHQAVEPQTDEPEVDLRPQVFVRTFTTPPGFPWEQNRAAQLEARHGAPVPLSELLHRIKRMAPWAPGSPGRYAVFYIRRRDYREPFETTQEVDGQTVRVAFGGARPDFAHAGRVAMIVVAGAAVASLLGGGCWMALSARAEAETRLVAVEQMAASRLRAARGVEADRERARSLGAARGDLGAPADALNDVAWVARSRVPEARIVAIHWERGVMAIEARGAVPPVHAVDRRLVRSERPLRTNLWLWGVSPLPPPTPATSAPVSAEPRS